LTQTLDVSPTSAPVEPEGRVFIREGFRWDAFDAYLFDIDGTLLRSIDRVHYNSFFSSVKAETGRDLLLDGVVVHGNTDPGILRDAFRIEKRDESEWQGAMEGILDRMRETVANQRADMAVRLMPGVEAVLGHLRHRGAKLGVATGNLEAIGWLKLEVAGLREWFAFGGFSDSYSVRSEMIGHAAALARAIAGENSTVCVVGDTPFDISAAKANRLAAIAVATGNYGFDELLNCGPDACTTTLRGLLDQTPQDDNSTRSEYEA